MASPSISIPVDVATAEAYDQASEKDRKKIQLLLSLRVHELLTTPTGSLFQLIDEIGAKAQARGLTPEILNELLHDD